MRGSRLFFSGLLAAGCLAHALPGAEPPLVATLHPLLTEWVETLAGDAARAECVLPPSANLHQFDPSPRDLARLQDAVLVVAMGKHLEPYLDRLRENLPSDIPIFEAGRKVPSVKVDPSLEVFACCPVHTHGAIDPHWWHSPVAARRAVRMLGRELEDLLPEERDAIRKRTREVMDELEALHDWTRNELAKVPRNQRKLVTAHAAFGYFCVEYDFQAVPVKGLTHEGSPTPGFLADTVRTLREEGVKAVFPERGAGAASLEAIRESTGVTVADPLIADFLAGDEDTYVSMFRHNVKLIVKHLGDGKE